MKEAIVPLRRLYFTFAASLLVTIFLAGLLARSRSPWEPIRRVTFELETPAEGPANEGR